jgi:transitional endoplasmic reticulum ATPase
MIDPALIRPGRLLPVEVRSPDRAAREGIFRIHLKELDISRSDMARLLKLTEGYTGAQIELACNRARMAAMRETDFSPDTRLEIRHILAAIGDTDGKPEHLSEYI